MCDDTNPHPIRHQPSATDMVNSVWLTVIITSNVVEQRLGQKPKVLTHTFAQS
jgi:hypothetical protein